MTIELCTAFTIDPIKLRTYKSAEVFKFVKRTIKHNKQEKKKYDKNGNRIIYRPAGNDWF